jgi:hypothetical protein
VKRSKEEAEVIVRLDFSDHKAHICVANWPAMAKRMGRLYGKGLDSPGGSSRRWVVPIKAVSFRKPGSGSRKPPNRAGLPFSPPTRGHFPGLTPPTSTTDPYSGGEA